MEMLFCRNSYLLHTTYSKKMNKMKTDLPNVQTHLNPYMKKVTLKYTFCKSTLSFLFDFFHHKEVGQRR